MSERNKVATKTVRDDNSGVDFVFSNDRTLACDVNQLNDEMKLQILIHGVKQIVGDTYSGLGDDLDAAYAVAEAKWNNLVAGQFRAQREGGGGGAKATDLARALARATGKELAEAISLIDGYSKEQKKELRKHPQIEAMLLEIQEAKIKAKAEKLKEQEGDEVQDLAAMFSS